MKIDIRKIKHHPLNREIYSLSSIDELAESINDVGLLQPLTIDQNNQIISGNRRFESIKRLGWKKVDINRITVKNGDEVLILVHFNKQRVKSIQEQLNEYDHLQKYYKKNKKSKGGVKSIRKKIGDDIKISDGQLARILFVRKHSPELIDLIDKQILTINQAYLQSSRSLKEKKSINNNDKIILENAMVGDWVFFQKSSDKMVELSDEEVDVIFTSPPFYAKRLYQKEGGIGNELTSDDYVRNLVTHLDDCYRVLNHSGSFFLNLGDTFKNGNLQNIPHKVSIQLQDKGWILRNTIIWSKKNPKPSASKTNLCPSYEFIFHMTKSTNYNYTPTLSSILSKTRPSLPPRHRSDPFHHIYQTRKGKIWGITGMRTSLKQQ